MKSASSVGTSALATRTSPFDETRRRPDRPVHVMHVVPRLWRGGMERNVVKLTNATDRSLVRSSICSLLPADGLKLLLREDVPLFEFQRRHGNDPSVVIRLARLMRRVQPDIIHSHTWGCLCESFFAARLARVPVIVHGEHGTMNLRWRNRLIQRLVWGRVDRLLSVSSTLAVTMSGQIGHPRHRIEVIYNGVNVERLSSGDPRAFRRELGVNDNDVLIVTVGRLEPVKDHALLLEALSQLRGWGVPFRAAVVGEGGLREQLAARADVLGIGGVVHFAGHRNDVEQVLAAADIFVLSSRSEGLPNGLMEAMAAGVPVVSTAVGGATELVIDGVTGTLVPYGSARELASALRTLVEHRETRTAFGAAGQRRAMKEFGFESMVTQYEEVYLSTARADRRLASLFA